MKQSGNWRLRFSLRTLLLFVVMCAFLLAPVGIRMHRVRLQRQAVAFVLAQGGSVAYSYQSPWDVEQAQPPFVVTFGAADERTPPGAWWLRKVLGDDYFTDVVAVSLAGCPVDDESLEFLDKLPQLRALDLGRTKVTSRGLRSLRHVPELETLWLTATDVDDRAATDIAKLTELKTIGVGWTSFTERGMLRFPHLTSKKGTGNN
jgi:hypothetical protein